MSKWDGGREAKRQQAQEQQDSGTGLIEKQIKLYQPIKLVTVRLQIVHNNDSNRWNKMQFQFLFCIEAIVYFPFDVGFSSIPFLPHSFAFSPPLTFCWFLFLVAIRKNRSNKTVAKRLLVLTTNFLVQSRFSSENRFHSKIKM